MKVEKKNEKMYLPSLDDLFTNQKTRDEADLEKVVNIKLTDIDDFPDHPFKVIVNDELKDMATSIKEKGVLSPALVRKKDNGKYYVSDSYYSNERLSNLTYLKGASFQTVLKGMELNNADVIEVNESTYIWSQAAATKYHTPFLEAFLNYYKY